jgi:hypothetical protein
MVRVIRVKGNSGQSAKKRDVSEQALWFMAEASFLEASILA